MILTYVYCQTFSLRACCYVVLKCTSHYFPLEQIGIMLQVCGPNEEARQSVCFEEILMSLFLKAKPAVYQKYTLYH